MIYRSVLHGLYLAELQIALLEPESDNKGLRYARAPDGESGSGSGMGSPTNVEDQSNDLSGLEIWHIGVISFGALSLAFCCVLTLMVSSTYYIVYIVWYCYIFVDFLFCV